MNIQLSFDSADEFASFLLSSGTIRFDLLFQQREREIPTRIEFFEYVDHIKVDGVEYAVSVAKPEGPSDVTCVISNWMCNSVQVENDTVFITNDGVRSVGSAQVHEYFRKNLPEKFLLNTGWRTDYMTFLFKQT